MPFAFTPRLTSIIRGFAGVLAVLLLVAACSDDDFGYQERSVEELYNNAMDELLDGSYVEAAQGFDEVERQHPYSVWATRAQIMAAYAYYKNNDYDESIISAGRFIKLHPGHRDVAYAYYLNAVSYYEQISDVGRDQEMTELALVSLEELVRRFPDTSYSRDARLKIDLTRDHLAGKEMDIGRYYLVRANYVAAVNRFRRVIERFQTTSHVPEALHRLTESYLALGVPHEAQAAAAVLGYNFPGSDWYLDSYALLEGVDLRPEADDESWISRAFNSIF
ncbi:MAG: Outer membrane protein assembly factor BamD [Alphaproteobacteria bacterium MarineAlpha10_Bin2]|nr:MAG: Outer membrane protein assembly factor BamD [Alphaproteobacteria bacterium MarineAlpha10_Bin2]HIM46521.1 outer membrane protein assembly factor BamD [Alphaproteobacteria bacterium]